MTLVDKLWCLDEKMCLTIEHGIARGAGPSSSVVATKENTKEL